MPVSSADINDHFSLQVLNDARSVLPRLCGALPHPTAVATGEYLPGSQCNGLSLETLLYMYMYMYVLFMCNCIHVYMYLPCGSKDEAELAGGTHLLTQHSTHCLNHLHTHIYMYIYMHVYIHTQKTDRKYMYIVRDQADLAHCVGTLCFQFSALALV